MDKVLFVLSPPRSFTSVVAACIGRHPDVFAPPELNLFVAQTMAEWLEIHESGCNPGAHGLLRGVAQIYWGEQTEQTIDHALAWVKERASLTTVAVFRELMDRVSPSWLLDKSHRIAVQPAILARILSEFPDARFLHLIRHPVTTGQSMASVSPFDPQQVWFTLHCHILEFLAPLPEAQKMRLRGEDILANPATHFRDVARWLELDESDGAIERMLHPEQSPFANVGPANARYGNAYSFLAQPNLRTLEGSPPSLDQPLIWRDHKSNLMPDVKTMAIDFGYN